MGENFIKYKKQAFVIRLVKSVSLGLAIGALLTGAFLLLSKFEILALSPIIAWLIGIAAFLLGGVSGFFLFRVSDRKLARRLDKEFALDEKVQTMIAFEKEEGVIYDLQREDTNVALEELALNRKRLKWKSVWIYVVCACIGIGALISSFILKPKPEVEVPPPEIPEEEFAITDIQVAAMEELIVYVGNSQMHSPYKENVVLSLEDLLKELKLATTAKERDEALKKSVEEIYKQTDESSVAVEIMNVLWAYESKSTKQLAQALNYYDWTKEKEWENFSAKWTDFRTSLIHPDTITDKPDAEKMATETTDLLTSLQNGITQSITRVGGGEEDTLCQQLKRLALTNETYNDGSHLYGISALGELVTTIGYEKTQKELDATFAVIGPEIFRGLQAHQANTQTGEYAMTKLKELFGYAVPKFERPDFYEATEGTTGGGEEGSGGAGIGDGAVYGSDDLVLDPMTNTYVEYGTILDKYYKLMFGKVEDGNYTEQEKEAIEKYFAILYGGFDTEGEETK